MGLCVFKDFKKAFTSNLHFVPIIFFFYNDNQIWQGELKIAFDARHSHALFSLLLQSP